MKPLPKPRGKRLAPKNLYYWELLYFPSKRPILQPGRDLICLGQKFYNDTIQETQWWGAPNYMEPQPHSLANFPSLQELENVQTWKEWSPNDLFRAGSLVGFKTLNRDVPCFRACLVSPCLIPWYCGLHQDDALWPRSGSEHQRGECGRKAEKGEERVISATGTQRKTRVGECYLETRGGSPRPRG
jgi:hypothetical protein